MPANIVYRDFCDVPRMFVARHDGIAFLFNCRFDDQLDEYPDHYHVYVMPDLTAADLEDSWVDLVARNTRDLGDVPVDQVRFDSTRRLTIESKVLEWLTEQHQLA